MRAHVKAIKHQIVVFDLVNQKQIRADVAFAHSFVVAREFVVFVFGGKFFAAGELLYDCQGFLRVGGV